MKHDIPSSNETSPIVGFLTHTVQMKPMNTAIVKDNNVAS